MPLWNKTDAAASAPKHKAVAGTNIVANAVFNNVTVGAVKSGVSIGYFGVDATEIGVNPRPAHTGWVKVQYGTGPVTSITVSVPGTGYSNNDKIRVSGGTTNATGNVVTNGSGVITSVTLNAGGDGFKNVSTSTLAITNTTAGTANGTGATLVPVLGGRAGRVSYETIVAMGITTDSENTVFPNT